MCQKGLGATLLQDCHPVTFVSEALTPVKQYYVKIEYEMLACVFGVEWFHTHVLAMHSLSRGTTSPLRTSSWRSWQMHQSSFRECCPTCKTMMSTSYTALVMPSPTMCHLMPQRLLDIAINHVHITQRKKIEFQAAIYDGPLLCSLVDTILAGWPYDINDVIHPLCPYHPHFNVLTVEDGLILYGKALVIPLTARDEVLQANHEGNIGITKYQYHAWQWVYWPGINSDIKCTFEMCYMPMSLPTGAMAATSANPSHEHSWQQLGADVIHSDGSEYLIIHYSSKMPIIFRITVLQCNAVNIYHGGVICRT